MILGNGFDIDLGIKTKYSQFADSPFWPFHENITFEEDSLPYFLNNSKSQVDTWFDLEELLANYACRETKLSSDKVKQAKEDFSTLTKGLSGNLVGISINFCKSVQKEFFINYTP